MSAFTDLNTAAATFNQNVMGESFSYTSPSGTTTTGLTGVFNQVAQAFSFEDFSTRRETSLICVSSKSQWGAVVPANRGTITYGGIGYTIEDVDGANTAGEPCYALTLKRLT